MNAESQAAVMQSITEISAFVFSEQLLNAYQAWEKLKAYLYCQYTRNIHAV